MEPKGRERRRFKRAVYPCNIYILTAPLHVIKSQTENIGAGGVRVIIDERIPISSKVGIKLYLSERPIECKGRIVWVVENKDNDHKGCFDTGIEFYQISDEDQKTIDIFVKSLV